MSHFPKNLGEAIRNARNASAIRTAMHSSTGQYHHQADNERPVHHKGYFLVHPDVPEPLASRMLRHKQKILDEIGFEQFEDARRRFTFWLTPEEHRMINTLTRRCHEPRYSIVALAVRMFYEEFMNLDNERHESGHDA